eukprot:m.146043 g.146043  ORF g.146043 m.146043 type:complete len:692 (+) comp14961_c0_seq3:224-2299(+)
MSSVRLQPPPTKRGVSMPFLGAQKKVSILEKAKSCPVIIPGYESPRCSIRVYAGKAIGKTDIVSTGVLMQTSTTAQEVILLAMTAFGLSEEIQNISDFRLKYVKTNGKRPRSMNIFSTHEREYSYTLDNKECPLMVSDWFEEDRRFELSRVTGMFTRKASRRRVSKRTAKRNTKQMKGKENVNDGNIGQQKVKKFSVIPLYSIQGNGSKATITPLLRQKPAVLRTPLDTLAADTARRSMYTIDHTQPCKVQVPKISVLETSDSSSSLTNDSVTSCVRHSQRIIKAEKPRPVPPMPRRANTVSPTAFRKMLNEAEKISKPGSLVDLRLAKSCGHIKAPVRKEERAKSLVEVLGWSFGNPETVIPEQTIGNNKEVEDWFATTAWPVPKLTALDSEEEKVVNIITAETPKKGLENVVVSAFNAAETPKRRPIHKQPTEVTAEENDKNLNKIIDEFRSNDFTPSPGIHTQRTVRMVANNQGDKIKNSSKHTVPAVRNKHRLTYLEELLDPSRFSVTPESEVEIQAKNSKDINARSNTEFGFIDDEFESIFEGEENEECQTSKPVEPKNIETPKTPVSKNAVESPIKYASPSDSHAENSKFNNILLHKRAASMTGTPAATVFNLRDPLKKTGVVFRTNAAMGGTSVFTPLTKRKYHSALSTKQGPQMRSVLGDKTNMSPRPELWPFPRKRSYFDVV